MNKPKLRFASSWDDGHALDYKIVEVLKKYHLPGTFYLSGLAWLPGDMQVYQGFEIGAHTANHPADMKILSDDDIRMEIKENREALQQALLGKKIDKFCYPRGRFNDRVIAILKELGFVSGRTTGVLKTTSADPFRTETAIHVYARQEYGDMDWPAAAAIMVEQASKYDGIFHIWGHSWEIERDKNWEKLDQFFAWLVDNYEIINA